MRNTWPVLLVLIACGNDESPQAGSAPLGGGGGGGGDPFELDECAAGVASCPEHSQCVDTAAFYECLCLDGFKEDGPACVDVDECQSLVAECDRNAECNNTEGSYDCTCPDGFEGDGSACEARYDHVATGALHACGIRTDGAILCWGLNSSGQLGNGTTETLYLRPTRAGAGSDWTLVTAGSAFTCALDVAGGASCWGANASGQLGDGTTTNKSSPNAVVSPPEASDVAWSMVDAGTSHACGVRVDGTLACWGSNLRGQIGNGDNVDQRSPVNVVVAGKSWSTVSAGSEFSCAVSVDHELYCWGLNTSRQLGNGLSTNSNLPVQESTAAVDWVSVSTGSAFACGIKLDGSRWCWGTNSLGQQGDGTTTAVMNPTLIPSDAAWKRIVSGELTACGVHEDNSVSCWGDGTMGQTGQPGAETLSLSPVALAGGPYLDIEMGQRFACAVAQDHNILCWGAASRAATGLGYTSDRSAPARVGDAEDWQLVDVQLDHGCAIRRDGELDCWGRNPSGQLGSGTLISSIAPQPVDGGHAYTRVATGRSHTCALASDAGTMVYCWGTDGNGELGTGAVTENASTPTAIAGVTGTFVDVTAGFNHSCALLTNGQLYCWGRNANGQLGDGTTTTRQIPVRVDAAGPADFVAVSANGNFTCAIRATDKLYCWGVNDFDQLGLDSPATSVLVPTLVSVGAVAKIAAGATHACATLATGALRCWGRNASGELGLGMSGDPHPTPEAVGASLDWMLPATGQGLHTCGIRATGELWCWGSGSSGQLGMGSLASFNVPTLVPSVETWSQVSLGSDSSCGIRGGKLFCWGSDLNGTLGSGVAFTAPTKILQP